MAAFLTANPEKRVYTDVNITVERNVNKPQFEDSTIRTEMLATTRLGSVVAQVAATDDDEVGKWTPYIVLLKLKGQMTGR